MGEFDKPKNERSAWDSPVGTRSDGTSSLDAPTGTKKYSLAAPSAGDRAAKRERKTNDLIDRNLQRAMRTGTPQQRVAAGIAYQERSRTPGYQQGGGIQSAEGNRNRDRKTADNFTKEGLRLEGKENPADVVAGQADAANKGVGVATADGGTNSKIGTSAADGGDSKIGTAKADASGRPRVTGQFEPGSELDKAEKNIWSKDPKPDGIGSPDEDGNFTMTMDFRDSDKNGVDDKEDWLKRNPAPVALGNGSGSSADAIMREALAEGYTGGEGANVGQSATPGATKPPVAQGGAGNGTPAGSDADRKLAAINKQTAINKFGSDLANYATTPAKDRPDAARLFEYGKTLGINEDQINAAIRGEYKPGGENQLDAGSAAISAQVEAKGRADQAAAAFGKAYGAYLNGAGKTASKEEKDAKYAELKSSAGLTVKPGDGGMEMPAAPKLVREPSAKSVERSGLDLKLQAEMNQALDQSTGKVNDITDSLGGKIDSSLEFKTESDRKYEAAIAPSRDALKKFEAETPGREANIEKNYQDGRAYVAQLGEDRALYLEDVVRNSEDFLSYGGYKRHITGVRKDAKSPEVDWDAFDKREPGDPNYGAKRYESQYDANGDFKAADYVQSKAPSNPSTYAPATMGGGLIERKKTESGPSSRETLEAFKLKQQENKKKFPGQASVDNKLQQREAAFKAPINDVLERANLLRRYTVTV